MCRFRSCDSSGAIPERSPTPLYYPLHSRIPGQGPGKGHQSPRFHFWWKRPLPKRNSGAGGITRHNPDHWSANEQICCDPPLSTHLEDATPVAPGQSFVSWKSPKFQIYRIFCSIWPEGNLKLYKYGGMQRTREKCRLQTGRSRIARAKTGRAAPGHASGAKTADGARTEGSLCSPETP